MTDDPSEIPVAPLLQKVTPAGAFSNARITYVGQGQRHIKDDRWGDWGVVTLEAPTEGIVRESLVSEGFAKWRGKGSKKRIVPNEGYRLRVVKVVRDLRVKIVEEYE